MAVPAQKPLDAILPLAVFYNMCPLTVNAGADETAGDYTADALIEKCRYPQKNHEYY